MQGNDNLKPLIHLLNESFKGATFEGLEVKVAVKALDELYQTGKISPEYYQDTMFVLLKISQIFEGIVFSDFKPSKIISEVIYYLEKSE